MVLFLLKSSYHSASDIVIMQAAAKQLNKDPNELTDYDFTQITQLNLSLKELSDIKLLEKFTNLQELSISGLRFPESALPKWKKILVKLHLIKKSSKKVIELKPIKGCKKLQKLRLSEEQASDLKPLLELENLKTLSISGTFSIDSPASFLVMPNYTIDLESIKKLNNLEMLNLEIVSFSQEQQDDLHKANPDLKIDLWGIDH